MLDVSMFQYATGQLAKVFLFFFRQNDTYYNKAKKCSRQKTIESIGWLNELEKQYDDPIAHFQKRVEQLKADKSRQYCCI